MPNQFFEGLKEVEAAQAEDEDLLVLEGVEKDQGVQPDKIDVIDLISDDSDEGSEDEDDIVVEPCPSPKDSTMANPIAALKRAVSQRLIHKVDPVTIQWLFVDALSFAKNVQFGNQTCWFML